MFYVINLDLRQSRQAHDCATIVKRVEERFCKMLEKNAARGHIGTPRLLKEFKANICSYDVNIKKRLTFFVFKGEFKRLMKAVEFGQKFIYFSFFIQNGKRVVNISEVCWRLLRLKK